MYNEKHNSHFISNGRYDQLSTHAVYSSRKSSSNVYIVAEIAIVTIVMIPKNKVDNEKYDISENIEIDIQIVESVHPLGNQIDSFLIPFQIIHFL